MQNIPSDPIRSARFLSAQARQECDPNRLIKYVEELRLLGRPDLSISILDSLIAKYGLTKESLHEKAFCLGTLGHISEALEVVSLLKRGVQADFDDLKLELQLIRYLGGEAIPGFDYGNIIGSIRSANNLEKMLAALPLSELPIRYFPAILKAVFKFKPSSAPYFSARYLHSKLELLFAKIIVALCFCTIRVVSSRKNIYFSSMGKFTRLADLVDQVDPLLRRLDSSKAASDYKLFIFFFGGYPNRSLFELYKRHCTFLLATNRVIRRLVVYFIKLLKLTGHYTEITVDYRKIKTDFLKAPPVISFNTTETRALRNKMGGAGIDPDKPFICFGLRDMAYYRFYGDVMNIPLGHQRQRSDTHHRCPPIDNYISFAKFWAQRGYQVVRMGLKVSETLPKDLDPLIIDYAVENRSDDLDAFLLAHCKFLTAGDTGLFSGAAAFDRPSIVSDLFLIQNTIYSSNKSVRNIFVPKLIYDIREDRYLSFREQVYINHFFSYQNNCEMTGFKIIHNTSDDIIDASVELVDRLSGIYEASREDDELQKAFHKIYAPDHIGYGSTGIISTKFLRKHSSLLD